MEGWDKRPRTWRLRTAHMCLLTSMRSALVDQSWSDRRTTVPPEALEKNLFSCLYLLGELCPWLTVPPVFKAGHTQIFLPFCCQTACCFSLKRTTSDSILKKHKREYGQINKNPQTIQEQTNALVKNSTKPSKMEDHILDQGFHW